MILLLLFFSFEDKGDDLDQEEKELGFMVMEALALLLSHNQKNASNEK